MRGNKLRAQIRTETGRRDGETGERFVVCVCVCVTSGWCVVVVTVLCNVLRSFLFLPLPLPRPRAPAVSDCRMQAECGVRVRVPGSRPLLPSLVWAA